MSNNPNQEDKRRDHLIGAVRDGLQEFYPELKDVMFGWNMASHLATVYRDTGNDQADYEFLRDEAEKWLDANQ